MIKIIILGVFCILAAFYMSHTEINGIFPYIHFYKPFSGMAFLLGILTGLCIYMSGYDDGVDKGIELMSKTHKETKP